MVKFIIWSDFVSIFLCLFLPSIVLDMVLCVLLVRFPSLRITVCWGTIVSTNSGRMWVTVGQTSVCVQGQRAINPEPKQTLSLNQENKRRAVKQQHTTGCHTLHIRTESTANNKLRIAKNCNNMIPLEVIKRKIPLILSPYTIYVYTLRGDVILHKDTRGQYLPPPGCWLPKPVSHYPLGPRRDSI